MGYEWDNYLLLPRHPMTNELFSQIGFWRVDWERGVVWYGRLMDSKPLPYSLHALWVGLNRTQYGGLSQNVRNLKSLSNVKSCGPSTTSKSNSHKTFATNNRITATAIAPPGQPLGPWLKGFDAFRWSSLYLTLYLGWSAANHRSGRNLSGSMKNRGLLAAAK